MPSAHAFTSEMKNYFPALAIAAGLHLGLVAWLMAPSVPLVIPQQQVVRVAMIAAPAAAPAAMAEPERKIVTPAKAQVAPKKAKPIPQQEAKPATAPVPPQEMRELANRLSALSPSSGPQSPDATQENAALSEPVFNAAYLKNEPPAYPESAWRNRVAGKVMLRVQVTREGRANDISVLHSSGSPLLDETALRQVRRWKFIPARRGEEAVDSYATVPIEFKLG